MTWSGRERSRKNVIRVQLQGTTRSSVYLEVLVKSRDVSHRLRPQLIGKGLASGLIEEWGTTGDNVSSMERHTKCSGQLTDRSC